ncbi:MAG: hypothetical protein JW703_02270 [Candidatus Diapherotrites archaeon]|nr:hypothetical protein [Candidatus Diapherotrites archaeon]
MNFNKIHGYLIVAFFCLLIYGFFSFYSPELYGNDSFFHIKISELMLEKGVITEFPWMQFTPLNENFVDKHFLYHVYLMPFTLIGNLSLAMKTANLILLLACFLFFYFLLKKNKVNYPEIWTLIAMSSSTYFIYRLLLGRAITLGVLFILVGIYLMQEKKYKEIFALSFVFVWSYAAFPALPMLALLYAIGTYFAEKKAEAKIFLSSLVGTITGIIINPYFPNNILLGFGSDLRAAVLRENGMGIVEWSSVSAWNFFANNIPIMFALIAVISFVFIKKLELDKKAVAMFFPLIYFLILNLKSIRLIDFFAPLAIFFSAIALNPLIKEKKYFKHMMVLGVICFVFCGATVYSSFETVKSESEKDSFKPCAEWLKENSEQNEIVFLWQYDDFPKLFYFNSWNYYSEGLDSYYLKDFNTNLFEIKEQIEKDLNKTDLIKTEFNSKFIFIEKTGDLTKKINELKNSDKVKEVKEWAGCAVIELK